MNPAKMAAKAVVVLAAVGILGGFYWFYLSPDRENHWAYVRARGRIAPIAFKGTVIDQYGVPVPSYEMLVTLYPGGMNARPRDIVITTNKEGEFSFESGSRKAMAAMIGGNSDQSRGGEWYERIADMGGYFVYQGDGEWLWRYDPGDPWKKLDGNTRFVYRIGHMGPPERMIRFRLGCNLPRKPADALTIDDEIRFCVNVLTGECGTSNGEEADIEIKVHGGSVRAIGRNGTIVQMAKDPFLKEAPAGGYASEATVERRETYYWAPGGRQLYFCARKGQVYGRMGIDDGNGTSVIVANPRGERNLNYGSVGSERSPIPLPVTLPFKEDVPFADPRKIWAYADPGKKNTLIVEGEKGAVEPGARVAVIRMKYLGIGKWEAVETAREDGSFQAWVNGDEGDPIQIKISLPKKITAQDGTLMCIDPSPDDRTVVLAPRWKLRGMGTP